MSEDLDSFNLSKPGWVYQIAERAIKVILAIATAASILLAIALLLATFHCFVSLSKLCILSVAGRLGKEELSQLVPATIHAIELLLLMPLGYLLMTSLASYVTGSGVQAAKSKLLGVKALTVGLIAMAIAVNTLGQILSGGGLSVNQSVAISLILIVLILFSLGLERAAKEK